MSSASRDTLRYDPVNACIYCGSLEDLTDEHVIPYSLSGNILLPKASCKSCAEITHKFERTVARRVYGNFRIHNQVRTRRPKSRPTHLVIGTNTGNKDIPISEHHGTAFVCKFRRALALKGVDFDLNDNSSHWLPVAISDHKALENLGKHRGWDRKVTASFHPLELAKTIAKIGYSYAIGEFGCRSFYPLVTDLILGKSENFSYFVGGDWELPPPQVDSDNHLGIELQFSGGKLWVVPSVRLFSPAGTPKYHVAVGYIDAANPVHQAILEKHLKAGKLQFPAV